MSLRPAYFTHGRAYGDRELDPSLVQPINPFKGTSMGDDLSLDDFINAASYAEVSAQLGVCHMQPQDCLPMEETANGFYLENTMQSHLYFQSGSAGEMFNAPAGPMMASPMPPPPMPPMPSIHSDVPFHHHDYGMTPVYDTPQWGTPRLTHSPSASSSISSMSDLGPITPACGPPPMPDHMYQNPYCVPPPPLTCSPPAGLDYGEEYPDGPIDTEDEEYEEHQRIVANWITKHTHPSQPDICPPCNKRFNRVCDFRRHVESIHVKRDGGWPCTWPGCTRILCRKDVLQRHVKRQHEEKERRAGLKGKKGKRN